MRARSIDIPSRSGRFNNQMLAGSKEIEAGMHPRGRCSFGRVRIVGPRNRDGSVEGNEPCRCPHRTTGDSRLQVRVIRRNPRFDEQIEFFGLLQEFVRFRLCDNVCGFVAEFISLYAALVEVIRQGINSGSQCRPECQKGVVVPASTVADAITGCRGGHDCQRARGVVDKCEFVVGKERQRCIRQAAGDNCAQLIDVGLRRGRRFDSVFP